MVLIKFKMLYLDYLLKLNYQLKVNLKKLILSLFFGGLKHFN